MPVKRNPQTSNLQSGTKAWAPCLLTWYDPALGGTNSGTGKPDPQAQTASGERYNATAFTCAAPTNYPFGTVITFRVGDKQVSCRVNDRGGAITNSHFDLSRGAARALGIIDAGRASGSFMVGGSAGSPSSAPANNAPDQSGGDGGGGGPSSVLDLLTAPVDTIGGWLASIALNLIKDVGEGIADYIIRPAWHWNQRAAMQYQQDMFADTSGKQVLWTGAFWGLGYWLLFTDPNTGNVKPAPVRNSRLARHARLAQSVPARTSLVKPDKVREKTPKKPPPIESRAPIVSTGTMSTTRHHRVKVSGHHASRIPVARENPAEAENFRRTLPPHDRRNSVPNAEPRTRPRSLSDRGRDSEGATRSRPGGGGQS